MLAFLTALKSKLAGSALAAYVGNRIYFEEAPENAPYPYVVYFIVTSSPGDTFTEDLEEIQVQFSLFSDSEGATEIATIYGHLTDLMDDAVLTVTGYSFIQATRGPMTPVPGSGVKHWAKDYGYLLEKT